MTMTDTDHLSVPTDMVEILKRLTKFMRDAEALPDKAQQHFWDATEHSLEAISSEDLRLDGEASERSVRVLYNILSAICGPQLAELVNGEAKEYYERLLAQMQEVTKRPPWDVFLDQKFDETKGMDHEGRLDVAMVVLSSINNIGRGVLRRVEGNSKLLTLTGNGVMWDGKEVPQERYFTSRDIIMMEFAPTPSPKA